MKFNHFFILTAVFSLTLLSCEKNNELTPNPTFDPEATNTNSGNNNGGGNGGGTIVNQGLAGNFGGTSVTINDCFFEVDSMFNKTSIEARSIDSSKTVNFVITEIVTKPKTYRPSDPLTIISYDFDATDTTTDSEYFAYEGELTFTLVGADELKATFFLEAVNLEDTTQRQTVTGGSFTAVRK